LVERRPTTAASLSYRASTFVEPRRQHVATIDVPGKFSLSPYFSRYPNFLTTPCRVGQRKDRSKNKLDPFIRFAGTPTCNRQTDTRRQLIILYLHSLAMSFSTLTLLVGRQEEHPACKNWMGCWCNSLSTERCRLFAYGPADGTATPKPHHLSRHLNPDWFYFSDTGLPRLSWKRGR